MVKPHTPFGGVSCVVMRGSTFNNSKDQAELGLQEREGWKKQRFFTAQVWCLQRYSGVTNIADILAFQSDADGRGPQDWWYIHAFQSNQTELYLSVMWENDTCVYHSRSTVTNRRFLSPAKWHNQSFLPQNQESEKPGRFQTSLGYHNPPSTSTFLLLRCHICVFQCSAMTVVTKKGRESSTVLSTEQLQRAFQVFEDGNGRISVQSFWSNQNP